MTNTNAKTTRTAKISKADITIKMLLLLTFPTWKGRKITIIEAAPSWQHTVYVGDQTTVIVFDETMRSAVRAASPAYGRVGAVIHSATPGKILVILSTFQGQDCGIEIVIPAIDADARSIAVDAWHNELHDSATDIIANAVDTTPGTSDATRVALHALAVATQANADRKAFQRAEAA